MDELFDAWVRHCFDHPVAQPQWYFSLDAPVWSTPATTTIAHLERLFNTAPHALAGYSDEQVDQGLWYIVHNAGSDHMFALVDETVPLEARTRCVRQIYTLFADLLAPRSANVLSHLPETHPDARPLNSICYMWWDLMPIAPAPLVPARAALDAAILDVMARTLRLDSIAAQESALHGLGHWAAGYPNEVGVAIDRFLAGAPADPELAAYATSARQGCVL